MKEPLESALPSRFVVGIDLGTTNSALNYVDTEEVPWRVQIFRIPQLVAPGEVDARETLPSFHFEPAAGEMSAKVLGLPWNHETGNHETGYCVGWMARDHVQGSHARVISSAKSWLCHAGVDRTADILPWHAAEGSHQISPIEASARYLRHLRDAWDHAFRDCPLAEQDIVLTLPASFDEIARELTVEAAARAGLPRVVLIEEPQAAFYAWVDLHRDDWQDRVHPGENILIIDVGGGTSDLTLIRVRRRDSPGEDAIQFHRVAVGDHLILGGDNLDLALAHHLEENLGGPVDARTWEVLVRQARRAKEILLGDQPPEEYTVHVAGTGSKLVGGSRQVSISRSLAQEKLVDGFFPIVALSEDPQATQSGFQEFSLPYAKDPAITRYLARFLRDHATQELGTDVSGLHAVRPDIVLFNGGVFSSPAIRQRVLDVLLHWFGQEGPDRTDWQPQLLQNARLDQAVAHGAAYYGMVRRGEGVRIAAGLARSYYLGLQGDVPTAVCLVPGTAEPGDKIVLEQPLFHLLVSQPAEFPLYVSSTRLADASGAVLSVDRDQMKPLPPLRTVLQAGRRKKAEDVPVRLSADLTEIGTVELWCDALQGNRRWRLQFDVRSAVATDVHAQQTRGEAEGVWEESAWISLEQALRDTFGPAAREQPATLLRRLQEACDRDRWEWPMPLLRRLWEALMAMPEGRGVSPQHESRWLNLLGFSLRPGYGMAVDDWRVTETWRTVQGKLAHRTTECRTESWILWRRIAGGLPANQQRALAEPYLASFRSLQKRFKGGTVRGDVGFQPLEAGELFRMMASLEWLPQVIKREIGDLYLDLLERRKYASVHDALRWGLGRLGSRVPLYGPLNTTIAASVVETWLERLMDGDSARESQTLLTLTLLARRTSDRQRDISLDCRDRVTGWLADHQASQGWQELVTKGGELDRDMQRDVWGDTLPPGLRVLPT